MTMTNKLRPWFSRQDWADLPKGTCDGTLFSVRLPLPLELTALDQHCAPYISGYGPHARPIPSLKLLIESDERTKGMGIHPLDGNAPIEQIYICDPTEEGTPISDCCRNGWWCVSFKIQALVPEVTGPPWDHGEQADALLSLLGRPTYIETAAPFEPDDPSCLRYRLIYEYETYTLVFDILDTVSRLYERSAVAIKSCMYYPTALWEKERGRNDRHWNLYHILKKDQQDHPMPKRREKKLLEWFSALDAREED